MPDPWKVPEAEVVALVASAGGLDALSAVLRELPADLPAAVVVQQHLGGRGSVLPQILRRLTGHQAEWAADGAALVPGRVSVCPPRRQLEVLPDGTCSLSPLAPLEQRPRPHDVLLTSLADSFGTRAVAVVLSGSGNDAAAGVAALKARGGLVIAQSEDSAEYPAMPGAAARAGADLVLPLHEIAGVLADLAAGAPVARPGSEREAILATFGEPGEVAAAAHQIDWDATPLGQVHLWPACLRAVVRLAMDAPEPAAVLWGPEGLTLANDAATAFLRRAPLEVLARPHDEVFPEARARLAPLRQRALSGRTAYAERFRSALLRDGRLRDAWWDVGFRPVRDLDARVAGVLATFRERTGEVLAARRLRTLNRLASAPPAPTRREELRQALAGLGEAEDLPFAIAYLLDGGWANLAGASGVAEGGAPAPRALPLTAGGAWPLAEVVHTRRPIVLDDVHERFRGHVFGPERLTVRRAVLHPLYDRTEGQARDKVSGVLILGTEPRLPLDDAFGEFLSLAAGTIDTRLAGAGERDRARRQLKRLAELDRARTAFFSDISHEFRTPLTLMLGPLDELRRHPDRTAGEQAAYVDLLDRNTRRLLRLVDTLLDFSQIEAGRMRARFAPTDLAALTAEITAMFHSAAEAADLKLTLDAPPLPEPIWVDAEMWEKTLSNLLSNALKYTWTGTVGVTLRALAQHAELVVRDTGVGIPAEELPHVFERFHRVRGAGGRSHEGAGIGLALVQELVRIHHGRVRVTSHVGEGTTVTVWVPRGARPRIQDTSRPADRAAPAGSLATALAGEAARWETGPPTGPQSGSPTGPQLGPQTGSQSGPLSGSWAGPADAVGTGGRLPLRAPGAHVLIVDDDGDLRDYLTRLLAPAWRVTAAADAAQALALIRDRRPDLVLADVMMPGLDGFALLRTIRADPILATLPVLLLTARAGEETAIEGLLAGADDYVVKPFSARELVARVGAQLELSRVRRINQERLSLFLETENVGMLYFDHTGTVVDANQVFLRMSGYTRDQIEARALTWQAMTPPEWLPVSEAQLELLAATGRIGPYEKEYILADGTRRWMLFVGRGLADGDICEYCIDITDLDDARGAPRPAR
ncbi:chemotaxis protein CheB [Nonomuraea sp. NPDC050783]|uniref:chemotaxis protein CheB n=1 Tax=Nonomuraea sp. NPDC050783 TaxID=3154634 RepID=UPI003467CF24